MLDGVMLLWFLLTGLSVLYVIIDIRSTPEATVLKWGFVILTLFTGPFGAFFYVLGCREPLPGTHEQYVSAPWRQVLGSTMHCAAGDGLGIIVGAAIGSLLQLSPVLDIALEYLLGFGFGWAFFQAYAMKDMAGGDYIKSLRMTFIPEFYSMNCLMAGMLLVTKFWMGAVDGSGNPMHVSFWFIMSIALLVGFLCAYPMNWWLVSSHLKHGMMTVRANPHAINSIKGMDHSKHSGHDIKSMQGMDHAAHGGHGEQHDQKKDDMSDMDSMDSMEGMKNDANARPSTGVIFGVGVLSVVILAITLAIVLTLAPAS